MPDKPPVTIDGYFDTDYYRRTGGEGDAIPPVEAVLEAKNAPKSSEGAAAARAAIASHIRYGKRPSETLTNVIDLAAHRR